MTIREPGTGVVLTIAGHDNSSGAGITKDLEVFLSLGLFGLSTPTAFVIQGPGGVSSVHPVDVETLSGMLSEIEKGFAVKGIKIGVVPDAPEVDVIAGFLTRHSDVFVVLDPVASAKNGTPLITREGLEAMKQRLLPLVSCITPNLDEGGLLLGRRITDESAMKHAALDIAKMGPKTVVLKGGHLEGNPLDILFDGSDVTSFTRQRIRKTVHGTGCIFSSALLSFAVLGYPLKEAFVAAERVVETAMEESFQPQEEGYFYASLGMGDLFSRMRTVRHS